MKRALFLLFLILSLIPVTAESSKNQQYVADYKGMEAGGDIPRWIKYADNDNLKKITLELKIEKEKKVLLYKTESNSLSMAKLLVTSQMAQNESEGDVSIVNGLEFVTDFWILTGNDTSAKKKYLYYAVYKTDRKE